MDLQSIPGMLARLFLLLWKKMLSLRASGSSFDPEIIEQKGDEYVVILHIFPGSDEVVFTSLSAKGFDLAPASATVNGYGLYEFHRNGEWSKDEQPVRIVMPPNSRRKSRKEVAFMIKPRSPTERVKFVLSGGFMNRLSAKRVLT